VAGRFVAGRFLEGRFEGVPDIRLQAREHMAICMWYMASSCEYTGDTVCILFEAGSALWPTALSQILSCGSYLISRLCKVAHRVQHVQAMAPAQKDLRSQISTRIHLHFETALGMNQETRRIRYMRKTGGNQTLLNCRFKQVEHQTVVKLSH
jgi:hypothetical protein